MLMVIGNSKLNIFPPFFNTLRQRSLWLFKVSLNSHEVRQVGRQYNHTIYKTYSGSSKL